jgi:hypothetical protein
MLRNLKLAVLGAVAATTLMATAAQAGTIIGLVDGKWLVGIDSASRKVTWKSEVKGAGPLLGIDVRPADGALYGLTGNGKIVTIDPKSGQATEKSTLSENLKAGVTVTVDFNPVADRLRVMSSDGTNLRVNVDDGKAVVDGSLKFKDGDANAGKTPKVIAGAYTNSFKGTKATALYNIDAATGSLVSQAPPNDGVLNTIGSLGIPANGAMAFNIVAQGENNNGWLASGGNLYAVDLKTGKATMAGKIEGLPGKLSDIAWID